MPPALVPGEIAWHRNKPDRFAGAMVLLSRHRLFSAKERLNSGALPRLNDELHKTFQPYFDRVAAWFRGHAHDLIIFKDD